MLKAIALDVNTVCQLRCPHCYLPSDRPHQTTPLWLVDVVTNSEAEEIVVVGMEPFFNSISTECVRSLVDRHPRVSVITNGVNIQRSTDFLDKLHNVDISMDAGPTFWDAPHHGRGAVGAPPFQMWSDNIRSVRGQITSLYALNTLSAENCSPEKIDDMVLGARAINADRVMFSIFVKTADLLQLNPVGLKQVLSALESSRGFQGCADLAYLLVDRYHLDAEGLPFEEARLMIERSSVSAQVELLEEYPHDMRIARVDVSGLLQTTHNALWGPLRQRSQGIQLYQGDRITSDNMDELNRRFPYKGAR